MERGGDKRGKVRKEIKWPNMADKRFYERENFSISFVWTLINKIKTLVILIQ